MALAPLVYTHLEPGHALRPAGSDLARPRPLRALERPRLDAAVVGAASHRDAGGECRLRAARAAVGDARRHPPLPPARQQGARSSRVSLGVGRGDHHRSARAGHRDQRRHGDRRAVAGRPLQPARLRHLRLRHLRRVRRRLPDGRRRRRRRRRSPATSASTTCAGSTTTTTSRSKAAPTSRSPRTSRRASWATAGTCCASATPTTSTASSTRSAMFQADQGPADADHPRQPHRLRLAQPAGHRRGARRAARRRRRSA